VTRFTVRHETSYGYRVPVDIGLHLLRLTPLDVAGQHPVSQTLTITPQPARMEAFRDCFGNAVHYVCVETMHDEFFVTLDAQVDVARPSVSGDGPAWEDIREAMRADGFPVPPDVAEFVCASPLAFPEEIATAYVLESFKSGRAIIAALRDLTARIHHDFAYTPNLTNVSTRVAEVISLRQGVCQDFAHLMIAGLRGLGLPARYVSGYVYTRSGEGETARPGSDASHAWVSAWCGEGLGWVEFDPTNNLLVEDEHIVLAYGRDFLDATPLRGVILGGGNHSLKVAVVVRNLDAAENSPVVRQDSRRP
jgi:transglutaminase-like putative cysteine protease